MKISLLYAYILDNFNSDFNFDFNSNSKCFPYINLNIKGCLIIMYIICIINCADYHLPDHHVNIIQLSNSTHMYIQLCPQKIYEDFTSL